MSINTYRLTHWLLGLAVGFSLQSCSRDAGPGLIAEGAMRRTSFNSEWKFARYGLQADGTRREEPTALEAPATSDADWQPIDLPHDFAIAGPFRMDVAGNTGRLPYRGLGWYRKTFTPSAKDDGKRFFLDFDGVMANSKVWVNGQLAGGWPYGYSSFRIDLTPYLKIGQANVIAVRTDTEHWESRWYPGAGIYRNVWLSVTEPVHVDYNGVYVTTKDYDLKQPSAELRVEATVCNDGTQATEAQVQVDVFELDSLDCPGRRIASLEPQQISINGGSKQSVHFERRMSGFRLWDVDTPERYVARVTVDTPDGEPDVYFAPFGFRETRLSREGFFLNGRRVEIKGVCNHHDLGALGAAFNLSALKRQFDILREMGCNSIRCAHNPPAPELLTLADKMGFLVMDEAFDAWRRGKREWDYNKLFDEWHERDLEAMVRRDRNHPSVVFWSIGNEVMEQRDSVLTRHLVDIVHRLDPPRPVTAGYNDPDGGRASGAAQNLDLMGINYFFGQQAQWDADPRYQNMPTMGTETSSCVSTRGYYPQKDGPQQEWQLSAYDENFPGWGCTPDTQFRTLATYPHLLGEYVWTGFDYLGEPTPFNSDDTNLLNFRNDPSKRAELESELQKLRDTQPPSRSSYFGIVDLAGFPKDRYYLYQSQWRSELPMAHVMPHWTWPGREGKGVRVQVYTSGDEAEVFVNGKSCGRKAKRPGDDFRLEWDSVTYRPGTLKVVAYRDGKFWATDSVKTAGKPYALRIDADRNSISDGELAFLRISVVDREGILVPEANSVVHIDVKGKGRLRATDNGDPTSFVPFSSADRPAFNGLCLAIIAAKEAQQGSCTVTVSAPGLQSATTQLTIR